MDPGSPIIQSSRRRAALKLAIAAAKEAFKEALPATEDDILQALAEALPLARFSLLPIICGRPYKQLIQFEDIIYKISDRFLEPRSKDIEKKFEYVEDGQSKEQNSQYGAKDEDEAKDEDNDKDNDVEKDKDKLPADTADLEGIVDDLQSTANRSPRTERLFRGMEQALFDKWLFDVSDQEAVAMQPGLLKFPDTQNT